MAKFVDYIMQTRHPAQAVTAHEVSFYFNNDDDAAAFIAWLHCEGWEIFNEYLEEQHE